MKHSLFLLLLFTQGQFDPEIIALGQRILPNATIAMYNQISHDLLPTPTRPHYTFNLRDLSSVFQGMTMATASKIPDGLSVVRLWIHECRRVFKDRLINAEDQLWFDNVCRKQVELIQGGTVTGWDAVVPNGGSVLYTDLMSPAGKYEYIPDQTLLQKNIEECLDTYNEENSKAPMNLVMFLDAVGHVCRLVRILRQPQGNVLCLGVGGSGRQSLTRLATFIREYDVYQVEIKKGYSMNEWREDIKQCLLKAGLQQHPVTFLFTDTQIVNEQMVEDINNILNSGDLPNLYGPDEMEQIMTACRSDCQKKKYRRRK